MNCNKSLCFLSIEYMGWKIRIRISCHLRKKILLRIDVWYHFYIWILLSNSQRHTWIKWIRIAFLSCKFRLQFLLELYDSTCCDSLRSVFIRLIISLSSLLMIHNYVSWRVITFNTTVSMISPPFGEKFDRLIIIVFTNRMCANLIHSLMRGYIWGFVFNHWAFLQYWSFSCKDHSQMPFLANLRYFSLKPAYEVFFSGNRSCTLIILMHHHSPCV